MSTGEAKQVKVEFTVDENSANRAKRVISELIQQVQKLVDVSSKVNLGFGGGGGFGSATSVSGSPGLSSGPKVAQKVSAAGGGVTDGLVRAVQNSAHLFKGAADGSKNAFKIMGDSLRDHVRRADIDIDHLQRKLEGLDRTYEKLQGRQAKGGITGAAMGSVQGQHLSVVQALGAAQQSKAQGIAALGSMANGNILPGAIPASWGGGGGGGGGGMMSRFGSFMGGGGGGMGQIASQFGLGGLARFGGMMASPAGAIAALAAGGMFTASATNDNRLANLHYGVDTPLLSSGAKADVGQFFGGNAQRLAHGDVARWSVMQKLMGSDPNMKAVLSPERVGQGAEIRRRENRVGILENLKAGSPGGIFDAAKAHLGTHGAQAMGGASGGSFRDQTKRWSARIADYLLPDSLTPNALQSQLVSESGYGSGGGLPTTSVQQVKLDRAGAVSISKQLQDITAVTEAKLQEDPEFAERMNRHYSGAMGTLSMARAAGVSNRLRRDRNGNLTRSGLNRLEERFIAQGIDPGEGIGGMNEMAHVAGQGFKGYGGRLINIKAGGLHNAASLYGIGSQFGGGGFAGGNALVNSIQNRIGRGGVDINAGSQITGLGTHMMMGGGFSGTGMGLMSTLLDAGYTGSVGGDMRMARGMGMGMGALNDRMTGGIDPLQKALNASAAMQAAPNASYFAKSALMNMDPGTMMDALRNERVPPELAAQGVTLPMLKKYVQTQNQTAFSRVTDEMGAGTRSGDLMGLYKKTGDMRMVAGKSKAEQNAIIRDLAPALVRAGGAKDQLSAEGLLRAQAASEGYLKGRTGAGGSHSAAAVRGTQEGAAVGDQATVRAEDGQFAVDENGVRIATDKTAAEGRKLFRGQRSATLGAITGSTPEASINAISQALTAFVNSLRALSPQQGKTAPQAR